MKEPHDDCRLNRQGILIKQIGPVLAAYKLSNKLNLSRGPAKYTSWYVRPSKTQISLRDCAGWSESTLGAL